MDLPARGPDGPDGAVSPMSPSSPASRWLSILLGRSRSVLAGAAAVLVAGGWVASRTPVEWVPSIELSSFTITASWPYASARSVERYVAAPVERMLREIPGTARVESVSQEGRAYVRVEVSPERKPVFYAADLADQLGALRRSLPSQVVPVVTREVPEALRQDQGFMTLQLRGSSDLGYLRDLADQVVAPRLRGLPGIASIAIEGGERRELLVTLDEDRLRAHGIESGAVRQKLAEAFTGRSYGWLTGRGEKALLLSQGEDRIGGVARLPLNGEGTRGGIVRLADVAQVEVSPAPRRSASRVDEKPVVTLVLDRAPGTHLLEEAAAVRGSLAEIRASLPMGVEILVADDRSQDARAELADLGLRSGLGLLAIVAALLLTLRGGRAAAVVLFSAAVALSLGLVLMAPLKLTFNLLTLAGLVVLAGIVVSLGAVVTERILTERARTAGQESYLAAAARAVSGLAAPLAACTGVLIAVLIPMAWLSREMRSLFAPFALLASLTLAFSLLCSLSLAPVLGQFLPARVRRPSSLTRKLRRLALAPFHLATVHPRAALALLLLLVGLPTPWLPERIGEEEENEVEAAPAGPLARAYNATLGSVPALAARRWLDPLFGGVTRPFLREVELGRSWDFEERPEVMVMVRLPDGSGIERVDPLVQGFARLALESPAVERTIARVDADSALLRVLFPRESLATPEPFAVRERLIAQALRVAGAEVSISGLVPMGFTSGVGSSSGFTVLAYGPSYDGLQGVAEAFARRVGRDPRVAEVDTNAGRSGRQASGEVLRLRWGSEAVARTGLRAGDMAERVRARVETWYPSFHAALDGEPRMPVRLIAASATGQDLDRLLGRQLAGLGRGALRLGGLAEVSLDREPPAIERQDQQYKRYIRIAYRGPSEMGRELIDREIAAARLPPGYRLERPRYSFLDGEDKAELFGLALVTTILVLLVIAAVLESWRLAGLVTVCVPLAWVGVALGFLWMGETFGEGALLGVVVIIGLAANAGILLGERYRRLRRARPRTSSSRLALLAVRGRTRTIWTAALCVAAGLLPMLLVPGAKAFWSSLAITVVGGLLSAALLAPLAMVALLSLRRGAAAPAPAVR